MAQAVEQQYRDLLNPIKDPEKSFQVNIAMLLQNYIDSFIQGKVPPNFNSAALLLQGSSSIYGKKVEYLYNLAHQLYNNLTNQRTDDHTKKEPIKVKDKQKENKFNDPFFSTEIKLGKNLSCLKKKTSAKTAVNKRGSKNGGKRGFSIPVDLLPYDGEEKGDDFYDTNNDVVGKKGDFTLNKCRVSVSGWLMLPTVSSDRIPTENSPPDYTFIENVPNHCYDDEEEDSIMPESSPDEGVIVETPASSQQTSTPNVLSSQQTDEGVGSMTCTPSEPFSQPNSQSSDGTPGSNPDYGSENIPMDGVIEGFDEISKSARRSERHALKLRQIEDDNLDPPPDDNNDDLPKDDEEIVVVKRAIQKKNTLCLPAKLRPGNENKQTRLERCSEFCARTYFVVDTAGTKNGFNLSLQVPAFKVNTKLTAKFKERMEAFQSVARKTKKIDDEAEREDVDVEANSNCSLTAAEKLLNCPLEDSDIVIQNDPAHVEIEAESQENPIPDADDPPDAELEMAELPPLDDEINPANYEDIVSKQIQKFTKDVAHHLQDSDITKKVHDWEAKLVPFLKELDERESFDINKYGHRILNSFECGGDGVKRKKASQTFRQFCKGMTKWQIHRYFMALLPLANIGNVELSTEIRPDGEEDILITLLSKQMHHLQLEEFSSNGECSKE